MALDSGDNQLSLKDLRHKIKDGAGSLSDRELVAIMIASEEPEEINLCYQLIINKELSYEHLAGTTLPEAAVTTFIATHEFIRRSHIRKRFINSSADVYHYVSFLADAPEENFLLLTLNGAQELIKIHHLTKGSLTKTVTHPREIFSKALIDNANAIIIVHNHPAGGTHPSPSDKSFTKQLQEISGFLGVTLLDHIIVGPETFYSFIENGDLDNN
ncbi:MAG: hypothetical protein FWE37_01845 [Spirochaetaceae bacterium]|nr:hypothetical protein [Spirochaetaceae bacterium]